MSSIPLNEKKYTVTLEYCAPCDYSEQVLTVAGELTRNYQHVIDKLTLVMGSKGVFDVAVDGETIFSKAKEERFPETGEILTLFEQAVGKPVEKYQRG